MGGSSSKQKQSKTKGSNLTISTINTIDGDVIPDTKKKRKDKKKSPKQRNVKTTTKCGHDKKKSHVGCTKVQKSISFQEKTICGVGECGSQVYRKKSACPSCDARDMIMDQIRGRSGSEKSLRFSDFNRVVRQSRVYDLDTKPAEIPLDGVPDPVPQIICFICGVYTGSVTQTCRVCCHVYHNGCLQKIGHAMDAHTLCLAQMEIWSCHQCSDISRLLTREETHHASACLEELGMDPDAVKEDDYIHYKEKMYQAQGMDVTPDQRSVWIDNFRCATGGNDAPALDWTQFLQLETVPILHNRCKDSLVRLLTDCEFASARTLYKSMDQAGSVTLNDVKDSVTSLYTKFNHRWSQEDRVFNEQGDMSRYVSWGEFLRLLSIHMIAVRNNPDSSTHLGRNGAMSPSFDSIDDDEYKTCESDSDLLTVLKDDTGNKIDFSDAQALNESQDGDKSISILDDLSKTFNLGNGANNNADQEDQEITHETKDTSLEAADVHHRPHLWQNREHPNFTTLSDEPETRPAATEKIVNRRSEILVRPSTEEGRSPRRALSQKLVTPAYGLVDKIQNNDWNC